VSLVLIVIIYLVLDDLELVLSRSSLSCAGYSRTRGELLIQIGAASSLFLNFVIVSCFVESFDTDGSSDT